MMRLTKIVLIPHFSKCSGASFYMDVFARHFERELVDLRIKFEEAQSALALINGHNASMTPQGSAPASPELEKRELVEEPSVTKDKDL